MCVHIICTEGTEHVACYACEGQRTALWCPFTPSVFVFARSNVMHTSVRQTPFPCWSISPTLRLLLTIDLYEFMNLYIYIYWIYKYIYWILAFYKLYDWQIFPFVLIIFLIVVIFFFKVPKAT